METMSNTNQHSLNSDSYIKLLKTNIQYATTQ